MWFSFWSGDFTAGEGLNLLIIGVLSDTHIPYRAGRVPEPVLAGFFGVDLILHAGDITTLSVLEQLACVAPVVAVYGNVDPPETRRTLPRRRIISSGKWRLGLVHGDQGWGSPPVRALGMFSGDQVDAVVFGHSHQPYLARHDGVLLFNPGSPTDQRHSRRPSYGLLRLNETIAGEVIYL